MPAGKVGKVFEEDLLNGFESFLGTFEFGHHKTFKGVGLC